MGVPMPAGIGGMPVMLGNEFLQRELYNELRLEAAAAAGWAERLVVMPVVPADEKSEVKVGLCLIWLDVASGDGVGIEAGGVISSDIEVVVEVVTAVEVAKEAHG